MKKNNPMGIMIDNDAKVLVTTPKGGFVEAVPKNGFAVKAVKVVNVDEQGEVLIDEEEEKRRRQYSENAAIRTEGKEFLFALTDGPVGKFAPELKFETITKLVMLSTYAEFTKSNKDSMLVLGNKFSKKRPMTTADIQRELKLSDTTFYNFLKDVIPQVDKDGTILNTPYIFQIDGKYYLNRKYFIRSYLPEGSHTNINKIFIEPVRRLYSIALVSQHRRLGMVFALLPYINREWNIICWNPREDDPAFVNPLSMKEICEVLNLSEKNSARTVNGMISQIMKVTLKIDGINQFFCGLFSTDSRTEMVVNPNFIYIGRHADQIMQFRSQFAASADDVEKFRKESLKLK